ncbi:hypothetical protein [Jiangella mangrovi]|uniref:Uncharacterized protein n=1 Tax=Jiangella mangrovi TaxID=1524084 RepID=A0A7W9LL53_9ACTN|nr:hypothetical protein [Jiangella mangrovi]MBB5787796.1 hypothetical protein [Jiangella mangrovi]
MRHESGVRWSTPHQQSARLLIVTTVVASSALLAQHWVGVPWWLLVVLCAVAGVGTPVAWWLRQQAARWDQQEHALEATVRSALDADALPLARDAALEAFGVHRSHLPIPYLVRDAHAEVLDAVDAGRPVLVLGHPRAGKSRLGAEVVRRHCADLPLVVPAPPAGLAQLFGAGASPVGTVIWLDDLDRYLRPEHFRVEWLDRALRRRNVVVATMRAAPYECHLPDRGGRGDQWELLERFRTVWLRPDDDERARLAASVADPRLRSGVLRYGLGEYLGGALLAVERLRAGESSHPLAAALVRAAADWRRAGLDAAPEAVLRDLAPHYLPEHDRPHDRQPDRPLGSQDADEAVRWAGELIDRTVALLEPTPSGWRVFDFLVDHLAAQGRPIPDATWDAAIDHAGHRLVAVCHAAAVVHHRPDVAERAWRRAVERHPSAARFEADLLRRLQDTVPDTSWWTDPPAGPPWF